MKQNKLLTIILKRYFRIISRNISLGIFSVAMLWQSISYAQFTTSQLPQVGMGLSGLDYASTPNFANALYIEDRNWFERDVADVYIGANSPQINANGYPKYLNPGQVLRANPGQNMEEANNKFFRGTYVLTWKGDADIRLGSAYQSGSAQTGSVLNGRRVYKDISSYTNGVTVDILAVNPANPITEIRVWLPDPADPMNKSLEPAAGQPEPIWHPAYKKILQPFPYFRFMDMNNTNGNPQQDWTDRRRPTYAFMIGGLNGRNPAPGALDYRGLPYDGGRYTGMAYEYEVQLCNELGKDLWINIPHLATPDFITKLSQLIRYGSDGTNPYTSPQANPVYPGLNSNLKVYIEYSNEIWSYGPGFCQGDWSRVQAKALGIDYSRFNARQASKIWSTFQNTFGGSNRLIRVVGGFTGNPGYTDQFIDEANNYGPTLSPATKPDVMAVTTYFENGIVRWVYDQGQAFRDNASEQNLQLAFDELTKRLIQEQASSSTIDFSGGGGFGGANRVVGLKYNIPIISYEGGTSFYTDNLDFGQPGQQGITNFAIAMNAHPRMADIYYLHLNQAKSLGLWSHSPFVDISRWSKYGQWGHLRYLDQPFDKSVPGYSVKYAFLLDWMAEQANIRHIDNPQGAKPSFTTSDEIIGKVNVPLNITFQATGGDGARTFKLITKIDAPGLTFNTSNQQLSGTPSQPGVYYYFLRVTDTDGDPAYRIFSVRILPAPQNAVYASDDFGTTDKSLYAAATGSPTGWAGGWDVQGGSQTAYTISTSNPLSYIGLQTSGSGQGVGGGSYLSSSRDFKASDFNYLESSKALGLIGQSGSTLWMSALVKRPVGGEKNIIFTIDTAGSGPADYDEHRVRMIVRSDGNWGLQVRNATGFDDINTNVSAVAQEGQTVLLVLGVDFGVSSDVVNLYINPAIGNNPPATPNATYTATQRNMLFKKLGFIGGFGSNQAFIDDIRFGDTYKAVVPSTNVVTGSTVTVRARSIGAGANLTLEVIDQVVATGGTVQQTQTITNISQSFTDYTFNLSGTIPANRIRVRFPNDNNNDLEVDYVIVDGTTYQTEAATTYSVGYYNSANGCANAGYLQVQQLLCNGYFHYNLNATPPPTTSIVVRAASIGTGANLTVEVVDVASATGGTVQQTQTLTSISQTLTDYTFNFTGTVPANRFRIRFANDNNNDLQVTQITTGGTTYLSSASTTYSIGNYDAGPNGCSNAGYFGVSLLQCNGFFQYNLGSTAGNINRATCGTVTAQGENAPSETKDKAFDNNPATKWLDFAASTYIQYQFCSGLSYATNKYTITSANDAPERDPKNWTLQGSNNGTTWTTVDTRSNEVFAARLQTNTYTFTNTTAYAYYKFNITNNSGTITQVADITLVDAPPARLGVDETANSAVSIYPNPATGTFYVSVGEGEATVEISDVQGKVLVSKKASGTQSFESGSLSQGVYIVKVLQASGTVVKRLVIK